MSSPVVNPHPVFSSEWHVWKEKNEGWLPYHVGKTPSGQVCSSVGRCFIARPGVYRCGKCGKEFPTFTALEDRAFQVILEDSRAQHKGRAPCDEVGYYCHLMWGIQEGDVSLDRQVILFRQAEAQALSEAFGYPVRVFSIQDGNGHGTWRIERDFGPICGDGTDEDCTDLRYEDAIDEALRNGRTMGEDVEAIYEREGGDIETSSVCESPYPWLFCELFGFSIRVVSNFTGRPV